MLNPHIEASLSAFKARLAATADLPFWTPRPPRRMPRSGRPEPRMTRQYTQAMSTLFARDQRLGRAAVALAVLLAAQAGGKGHADVTRTYLARTLGSSGRTVARGLAELRACGYVRTEHRLGRLGQTVGLRCHLGATLLPYWECEGDMSGMSPLVKPQDIKAQGRGLQEVTSAPQAPRKRPPRCGPARDAARPRPGRRP
jgi:hypothetical protein